MSHQDWSRSCMVQLLPVMSELRSSTASLTLLSSNNAGELESAARVYLARALTLGLLPAQRFAPELHYGLPGQGNTLLRLLSGRPGTRRAATILAEGGESPWPQEIKADGQLTFSPASRMASQIFLPVRPRPEYVSELLMRQAVAGLPHLPDILLRSEFISACLQSFSAVIVRACPESSGVRGPADAAGLRASRLMILHGPMLALAAPAALVSQVEAALASAHALVSLKGRRPDACADPNLIKAQLTPQMEVRLRSLRSLFDSAPDDDEGARLMINASEFLRVTPLSACVAVRGAPTVLGAALRGACPAALQELACLGADPWLASSQEGSNNAFAWLFSALVPAQKSFGSTDHTLTRRERVERCLDSAALLLAGPAPGLPQRSACARLAAPVALFIEEARALGENNRAALAQSLWARCEALALNPVVAPLALIKSKLPRPRL